ITPTVSPASRSLRNNSRPYPSRRQTIDLGMNASRPRLRGRRGRAGELARDIPADSKRSDRYIRSAAIRQRDPPISPITLGNLDIMLSAGAYSFRQKSKLAISLSWIGVYVKRV